jgi:rhamnosyltransferase
MNYRRHGANVTAAQKYNFGPRRIIARMKNVGVLAKDHAYTYSQTLLFIKKYQEYGISKEQEMLLEKVEKAIRRGGIYAALYVLKNHISWGNRVKTISHFGIMLLGLYKKYLPIWVK